MVESGEAEAAATRNGQTASAETGPRAARYDGTSVLVCRPETRGDLFRRCGEGNARRHLLKRCRAIEGIGDQIFLCRQHVFAANNPPQVINEVLCQSHCPSAE